MNAVRGIGLFVTRVNYAKEQLFSSKNLFYTNVTISITLSALGDILEQHYEVLKGDLESWSPRRTRNMAVSGMSIGIVCHHWYRYLDARITSRTIGAVMRKVLIDQLVCSPLCIGMFFLTLGILEGSSWSEFQTEVREKARRLYVAEWIIWPPAQLVNFYFLPTKYRVLYDNTISLGYDIYTSRVKHDPQKIIKTSERR